MYTEVNAFETQVDVILEKHKIKKIPIDLSDVGNLKMDV
jgi:hypothetical protein